MTHVDSYAHGEPSWQDQISPDADAAAEYYTALFGWHCPAGDAEFGGYRTCTLNSRNVAGISGQMQPGPTVWSVYVNVEDAAAVAEKTQSAGGNTVVEPMQISEYGTMAICSDPTGAVFGVWQPNTHIGAQVRSEPGSVVWYELMTSDVESAAKFYNDVFGWTAHGHGPTDGGLGYQEFKLGDKAIAGLLPRPATVPPNVPDYWGIYIAVDDVDATAAKSTELGGKVLAGPMDIAPGRFAVLADSTGAAFNILHSNR